MSPQPSGPVRFRVASTATATEATQKRIVELLEDLQIRVERLADMLGSMLEGTRTESDARADRASILGPLKRVSTVAEVAEFAGVSKRTVERAIAGGHLKTLRPGGGHRPHHRITAGAVRDWLLHSRQPVKPE